MSNTSFKEIVDTAAVYFKNGSVDDIPQDLPVNYYPVLYSPYLRQEAITDSLIDAGLDLHRSSGVRLMAYHALKFIVQDCEIIEAQLKKFANRLNNPIH